MEVSASLLVHKQSPKGGPARILKSAFADQVIVVLPHQTSAAMQHEHVEEIAGRRVTAEARLFSGAVRSSLSMARHVKL